MFCQKHPQEKMTLLFTGYVCDICDPPKGLSVKEPKEPKESSRSWTLCFGPVTIPPGSLSTLQIMPGVFFKGKEIINRGDDTSRVFVEQIYVGVKSQFPTFRGPIRVTDFKHIPSWQLDECGPTTLVTFQIRNMGTTPAQWAMDVIGDVVEK